MTDLLFRLLPGDGILGRGYTTATFTFTVHVLMVTRNVFNAEVKRDVEVDARKYAAFHGHVHRKILAVDSRRALFELGTKLLFQKPAKHGWQQ